MQVITDAAKSANVDITDIIQAAGTFDFKVLFPPHIDKSGAIDIARTLAHQAAHARGAMQPATPKANASDAFMDTQPD
eukprot:4266700-Alexandrium_andersonii.AAC.1